MAFCSCYSTLVRKWKVSRIKFKNVKRIYLSTRLLDFLSSDNTFLLLFHGNFYFFISNYLFQIDNYATVDVKKIKKVHFSFRELKKINVSPLLIFWFHCHFTDEQLCFKNTVAASSAKQLSSWIQIRCVLMCRMFKERDGA